MKLINRCFDCPKATFKNKSNCICKEINGHGKIVNSNEIHPRCPLKENGDKRIVEENN